ncbi:MAG: TerC family protein [Gammaproteobacteria bacterium]|nr:TerC family protein [Gammaproteobacteria bacterium]
MDLFSLISPQELSALATVIMTDVVLAGDNAIVVGMAAAGLPAEQRRKAIFYGIIGATVLRILFAVLTTQLLQIIGLMLAGGILLLWVSWKLYRELSAPRTHAEQEGEAILEGKEVAGGKPKTFREAVTQIIVADISMSLDNVLAVAGAAREHTWVLIVGLALSVALMGIASTVMARLLVRHRWIGYIGLIIILYIALDMMWDGAHQVAEAV